MTLCKPGFIVYVKKSVLPHNLLWKGSMWNHKKQCVNCFIEYIKMYMYGFR